MTQTIAEEVLVKSRLRVKAHGEVFTPRHMVDQMLDLVRKDLEESPGFVDKTVLEPAAGDGNFLVVVLQRKLHAIERRFPRERWAEESLFALASIYAIELLEDNHADAQAAMLDVFLAFHTGHTIACDIDTDLAKAARFLIDANVVRGNTLTGLTPSGDEVVFSWWNRDPADHGGVIREPFTFNSLRADAPAPDLFAMFQEPVRYAPCRIDHVHEEVKAHDQ
ncbi:methylase [Oerskovia sp. Sa1BUA8]|uniref:Methylase n=1 Tax=Oerskovia douganii TaxID=2762210 RepID=A0A9D5UAA5_9CELL|nr:methylase [Oerskovia douganii]MBE7701205.1 methylase [Oerskovia douganii]